MLESPQVDAAAGDSHGTARAKQESAPEAAPLQRQPARAGSGDAGRSPPESRFDLALLPPMATPALRQLAAVGAQRRGATAIAASAAAEEVWVGSWRRPRNKMDP